MTDTTFPIIDEREHLRKLARQSTKNRFRWSSTYSEEAFWARHRMLFKKRELIIPEDRPLRAYIGASLFTTRHLASNRALKRGLNAMGIETNLPQEDGGIVADMISHGISEEEAEGIVFQMDIWADLEVDIFIGGHWEKNGDEGAGFELGVAWHAGKFCLAINRHPKKAALRRGVWNPMWTRGLAHEPFPTSVALCAWLKKEIEKRRAT